MRELFGRLFPVVGSFALAVAAGAQDLPQLGNVSAATVVSGPDAGGVYEYSYQLRNPGPSGAAIWLAEVDVSRDPGTADLPAEGLAIQTGPTTRSFADWLSLLELDPSTVVPFGCSGPSGWKCTLTVRRSVLFGNHEDGSS